MNRKISQVILENNSRCPQCKSGTVVPSSRREGEYEELVRCRDCGWYGSLDQLMRNVQAEISPLEDQSPDSCIALKVNPDLSRKFQIPASKRPGALLFFSLVWLLFSGVFFFLALTSPAERFSGFTPFGAKLFVGLFPLIGIILFVGSLWIAFVTHEILIRPQRSILSIRRCFGITLRKEIPIQSSTRVQSIVAYEQNDAPVHTVEVANSKKEKIRLSSQLSREDLGWMFYQFERALPESESAVHFSADGIAAREKPLRECHSETLEIRNSGRDSFRMVFSSKMSLFVILFGLIFAGSGCYLFWECYSGYQDLRQDDSDDFMKWFDLPFVVVAGLMGMVFLGVGASITIEMFKAGSRGRTIWFDQDRVTAEPEVFFQKTKKTWAKSDFDRVDLDPIGSSNSEPRYGVKLIGPDNLLTLCRFRTIDEATQVADWARKWLQT